MEKSKYSWVLIGTKDEDGKEIPKERAEELILESFGDDKIFQLFLLGNHVEKFATLPEMEEGLELVISEMKDYEESAYCIISKHKEGELLFCPVKMDKKNG